MKKYIKYLAVVFVIAGSMAINSCTNLEEKPIDKVTSDVLVQDPALIPNLIAPALGNLRMMWSKDRYWGLVEATTDELCFPTRGTDWFDNGLWQDYYLHNWSPTNLDIRDTWNLFSQGIASANFGISVLGTDENVSAKVKEYRAMLRFLRDFSMYNLVDLFGVSPYRDPSNTDYTTNPTYLSRVDAFNYICNDLKQILNDIPEKANADYGVPNRDAVRMLLAKMYINKEAFTGQAAWDSTLIYLGQIIDPGKYQLANNYFGMFGPDNNLNAGKADDEAIFVVPFDDAEDYGLSDKVVWIQITFHYNQWLSGKFRNWNGCMAPEEYLNECWLNGTDIKTDVRWVDSTIYAAQAVVNGFNYGQQYDLQGNALTTRNNTPLNFTFSCPLDGATEEQGVRVLKYAPRDNPVDVTRFPNDILVWRYADALLMKAECLARKGDMGGALALVNQLREKSNAPALGSLVLLDILKERGRELYWEGHRRQDQIRFGTFLLPKTNKDFTSPERALLCPIPQTVIEAANGALVQNPGY